MRDFWLALRSSWYYFRREYRRRVQATQRKSMPDPFTPALENTIRRVINEGSEAYNRPYQPKSKVQE